MKKLIIICIIINPLSISIIKAQSLMFNAKGVLTPLFHQSIERWEL